MIVPRNRLLFWVAVVVLPFALLAAVAPASAAISLSLIAVFFIVVIIDAISGKQSLGGIGIELPAVVRMSKDREARIELRISNPQQQPKNLRVALAWPREIKARDEEVDVALPANSQWSRLPLPCTPRQRGRFNLSSAFVGPQEKLFPSSLKFASIRICSRSAKTWRRCF
jgi:uncharacterized protein (DUF58 family)